MSNYNLQIGWSGKDAAAGIISGDDFNTEFTSVQTAINSKADLNGNASETFQMSVADLGTWTVTETSGVLYFAVSGTNKMKLDASGNLSVTGEMIAAATL
jgi:hypothetical protein